MFARFSIIRLYFVTAYYLKWRQLFYFIFGNLLAKPVGLTSLYENNAFYLPNVQASASCHFIRRWQGRRIDFLNGEFSFLQKTFCYEEAIDWNDAHREGLWLDHLHYFRYVSLLGANPSATKQQAFSDWLASWYEANPYGIGRAFYPPYNAAERSFNLGVYLLSHYAQMTLREVELFKRCLLRDLAYVSRHLEFKLDANHLLKNLLSLLWGTLLFEGPEVDRWKRQLARHLWPTLNEQILPDGMHHELSVMYHNLALVDLIDILILMPKAHEEYAQLAALARRMLSVSKSLRHPDGEIPLFNDASFDLGVHPALLVHVGESLLGHVTAPHQFPKAGYYRFGEGVLLVKAGVLGPGYQLGHTHCDTFTYELSLHGERVIVNTGTSTYRGSAYRQHERSLKAHNCLQLDGFQQIEAWSSFRVARRTSVQKVFFECSEHLTQLKATIHYSRGKKKAVHSRQFTYFPALSRVLIADTCQMTHPTDLTSYVHLAPGITIVSINEEDRIINLQAPNASKFSVCWVGTEVSVRVHQNDEALCYTANRFNQRQASPVITFHANPCKAFHLRYAIQAEWVTQNNLSEVHADPVFQ